MITYRLLPFDDLQDDYHDLWWALKGDEYIEVEIPDGQISDSLGFYNISFYFNDQFYFLTWPEEYLEEVSRNTVWDDNDDDGYED